VKDVWREAGVTVWQTPARDGEVEMGSIPSAADSPAALAAEPAVASSVAAVACVFVVVAESVADDAARSAASEYRWRSCSSADLPSPVAGSAFGGLFAAAAGVFAAAADTSGRVWRYRCSEPPAFPSEEDLWRGQKATDSPRFHRAAARRHDLPADCMAPPPRGRPPPRVPETRPAWRSQQQVACHGLPKRANQDCRERLARVELEPMRVEYAVLGPQLPLAALDEH